MPKLKKQCRCDFTVVNNEMIKDKTLGFAEKGLLLTMLSLPEDWNFSIKGLTTLAPDGEHKVSSSLKKLEQKGYLKRERIHSDNGRFLDWLYTFSDEPIFANVENSTSDGDNSNVENSGSVEKTENSPHGENRNMVSSSEISSPHCGFPDVDNPDVDNRITNKINNNKINNNILSINQVSSNNKYKIHIGQKNDVIDEMDYNAHKCVAMEQIDFNRLNSEYGVEPVAEIVELIAFVYSTPQPSLPISGVQTDIQLVRERFSRLEYEHIQYVLDCLMQAKTKIINRRSYLLTCLFSAPVTIDGYYANQVAHDLSSG